MSSSSSSSDTFEAWLNEIYRDPLNIENRSISVINSSGIDERVNGSSVKSCIEDFDLTLLDPILVNADKKIGDLKRDSVKLRISDIEDTLGIFQIAFWRVSPDNAPRILASLCCDLLSISVVEKDIKVVRQLDCRRCGVLVRIPSLVIKHQILKNAAVFHTFGYFVDVA